MKLNLLTITFSILLISLFVFASNAQTNDNSSSSEKKTKREKAVKPSDNENCPNSSVVRVRATFHKSGKITKVELIVSGGCRKFDEDAIAAAKKIKFTPKTENGEPVTVVKLIEYTFEAEQSNPK